MYQLSLNDNFPFNCQKHAINCYIYICVTKRDRDGKEEGEGEKERRSKGEKENAEDATSRDVYIGLVYLVVEEGRRAKRWNSPFFP